MTEFSETARQQAHGAAWEFVREALAVLEREHVLPVSWFDPHIGLDRDYSGHVLAGMQSKAQLDQLLQETFQDRFKEPPMGEFRDYPQWYVSHLLEEVVRRSGPGHRLDTDIERLRQVVFECVEELLEALRTPGFELGACRVVSHLTTANGQPIRFGDVVVRPAKDSYGQDGGILETIDKSIPGTAAVESLDDHLDYAFPVAIVEVRTGVTGFVNYPVVRLTEQMAEFVGAVRLLTGGTLASGAQIQGSTSWTGRIRPYKFDFRSPGWGNTLTRRVTRLDETHAEPIKRLIEMLHASLGEREERLIVSSLGMALAMFNRSHQLTPWSDRLVDLATALEAALIGDGANTTAVSLRLRQRAATLLACETDPARHIFKDTKVLYNLRSKIVHGGTLKRDKFEKDLMRISTIPEGTPLGTASEQAIDRLRDIVRRSILARISLTQGPNPLWPQDIAVDEHLADEQTRQQWRSAWQQHIADIGYPDAVHRTTPADIYTVQDQQTDRVGQAPPNN